MRTLLSAICVALSIYYVFAAPRHIPTSAPTHTTSDTRNIVEKIIGELTHLSTSAPPLDLGLIPTLYRNESTVTIEELSCRAQYSISHIKNNIKNTLKELLEKLIAHRNVTCPTITPEDADLDQVNIGEFTKQLLTRLQNHNSNSFTASFSSH